jgi:hypothetical protein
MKRVVLLLLVLLAAPAWAQILTKEPVPGLIYRFERDPIRGINYNAIRISKSEESLQLLPKLAWRTDAASGRQIRGETVSGIARSHRALAAINADFFPMSGLNGRIPLNLTVRDREVFTTPFPRRSVFAWGSDFAQIGFPQMEITMRIEGRAQPLRINGIDNFAKRNWLTIYTDRMQRVEAEPGATYVLVEIFEGSWTVSGTVEGVIMRKFTSPEPPVVPQGHAILVALGSRVLDIATMEAGYPVKFTLRTTGIDWERAKHAIGGGPQLVTDGRVNVDWQFQNFSAGWGANVAHPRTAIGSTADGHIWIVTADGRQPMSRGVSLGDLARYMISLGCRQAMNLDGGGSTAMSLMGMLVNRPSDGSERRVANALVVMGEWPEVSTLAMAIEAPAELSVGGSAQLRVVDAEGAVLGPRDVIWSLPFGPAWIDQTGTLRGTAEGTAIVRAFARGQLLNANVIVRRPVPAAPGN